MRSLNMRIAVFSSPQRLKNCDESEPTSPSSSTPRVLDSVDGNVVEERLSASVDKPSRSRKRLFDSSQSAGSSVVSGCIQIDTPVDTPSCATPVKASSVDVTNTREREAICSNTKPPLDNRQNGNSDLSWVPLRVQSDTPLTVEEDEKGHL